MGRRENLHALSTVVFFSGEVQVRDLIGCLSIPVILYPIPYKEIHRIYLSLSLLYDLVEASAHFASNRPLPLAEVPRNCRTLPCEKRVEYLYKQPQENNTSPQAQSARVRVAYLIMVG